MDPRFVTPAQFAAGGEPGRRLRREASRGTFVRVRPGLYLPADDWQQFSARERHLAAIRALLARAGPHVVVSHASAGAVWGFPVLDEWPQRVQVIAHCRTTGKVTSRVVLHPSRLAVEVSIVRGVRCTSASRTAVDMGLAGGFLSALLAFDYALATGLVTRQELRDEIALRSGFRGIAAVRSALEIAHPGSKSAGESISKGQIHLLGFETPELQKKFTCPGGRTYYGDFWWKTVGQIGEFDGGQKYLDERMRGGRTMEQVLFDEKDRTDALLALPEVRNIVRWRYAVARNPTRLQEILLRAGIPLRDSRRR
ncbi:hypothetical protein ASF54_00325 [Frondihabitans sp. Leaf304]|nr:hypothetical protein ASF54_00325 [Frondihabitans sp. Leaf304]